MTPHRKSVIEYFVDAGLQVVTAGPGFALLGYRAWPLLESMIDQSKIALNLTLIRKDDALPGTDPRFVSAMRVLECLQRDVVVVSEDIPFDNPYKDFMESAAIDELPNLCERLLESGLWDKIGEQNGNNFRANMNVKNICSPVIERTLSSMGLG